MMRSSAPSSGVCWLGGLKQINVGSCWYFWMCARPCQAENVLPSTHPVSPTFSQSWGGEWTLHLLFCCHCPSDAAGEMLSWCFSATGPREGSSGGARRVRYSEVEEGHALALRAAILSVPKPFSLTKPRVPPPQMPPNPL